MPDTITEIARRTAAPERRVTALERARRAVPAVAGPAAHR